MSGLVDQHDIALERDRRRRRRVYRWAAGALLLEAWFILVPLTGRSPLPSMPAMDPLVVVPVLFFVGLMVVLLGTQVVTARVAAPDLPARAGGRARWTTCMGIDPIKEDVRRSIDLFQTHRRFADQMGGTPRRGLLFEGAARDGQDDDRQGDGRRGRSAVPVRLRDVLPVDVLRRDRPQDPCVLRGAAQGRRDPRAARSASSRRSTRSRCAAAALLGPSASGRGRRRPAVPAARVPTRDDHREGTGGVVNELLVQMQSFDQPTGAAAGQPAHRRRQPAAPRGPADPAAQAGRAPILLIAATNRADSLDPALLRPGRFDRRLTFPDARRARPTRAGRALPRAAGRTSRSSSGPRSGTGSPPRPAGGRR